jgi:hypothetical protein
MVQKIPSSIQINPEFRLQFVFIIPDYEMLLSSITLSVGGVCDESQKQPDVRENVICSLF